jgi:uncharacterized protein involved in cysteine biosynthesis
MLALACFAVTLVALIGFMVGVIVFLGSTTLFSSPDIDRLVDITGSFLAVGIAWFLFPILTPVIAAFFSDRIADIVEQTDYPGQQAPKAQPLPAMLAQALLFTLTILLLNLLCLPLYFIPGVTLVVYYGLNSYLLGREFFEMVSGRYMDAKSARFLRKQNQAVIMGVGLVIVLATMVPLLNLLAPIIGVVLMVHVFFMLNKDIKTPLSRPRPHGHTKIK